MAYQMSHNLSEVLRSCRGDRPIELSSLSLQLYRYFDENNDTVKSSLRHVRGQIFPGTLAAHMFDCIPHDSVVRDLLTVGHLAKLLSRLDVFKKTADPKIVGLPHPSFDQLSLRERAAFFAAGNILPIDAELLGMPGVDEMLKREKGS